MMEPVLTDRQAQNDVLRRLLTDLDSHSPGERDHAERVAVYSVATGERMGMSDEELLHLRWAATLHDVGKVRVDSALLRKMGKLTDDEFRTMKLHSELYDDILESHDFLAPALPMIRHHHERFEGSGYPDGLAGDAIPLGARIIAVAEAFDVLRFAPIWREPVPEEQALVEIKACAGSHFDPQVVAAFLDVAPLIQPLTSEPF